MWGAQAGLLSRGVPLDFVKCQRGERDSKGEGQKQEANKWEIAEF